MKAALFDLDGTLVDSEWLTDAAIAHVMAAEGHTAVRLSPYETRGRTWTDIADALVRSWAVQVPAGELARRLIDAWGAHVDAVQPIPGAKEAVCEAARHLRVAVVSSSPVGLISRFLARLGLAEVVPEHARIGAEQVRAPKPAPEGFLLAAGRFLANPRECVVFEDSRAGLEAARAAGMATVLVGHRCAELDRCRTLADRVIDTYRDLPPTYWSELARPSRPTS